jgi:hypothetical protein
LGGGMKTFGMRQATQFMQRGRMCGITGQDFKIGSVGFIASICSEKLSRAGQNCILVFQMGCRDHGWALWQMMAATS